MISIQVGISPFHFSGFFREIPAVIFQAKLLAAVPNPKPAKAPRNSDLQKAAPEPESSRNKVVNKCFTANNPTRADSQDEGVKI